jgi:hypothetical protein
LNEEKADYPMMTNIMKWIGHNYIVSGAVVPHGEQPGIGSYRRLCLGHPAGQASNPCRKVFMGGGFRNDRCAFQPDRTDCPLW